MKHIILTNIVKCYNRLKPIISGYSSRYERLAEIVQNNEIYSILEIGTWKGRRAVQLISTLLSKNIEPKNIYYTGIDLFEDMNDKICIHEVSKISDDMDTVQNYIINNTDQKINVKLYKGFSEDILKNDNIRNKFDFIFIDGGHSYDTVKIDWNYTIKLMKNNTIVVFDDYVSKNAIKNENWGVNRLIEEIDKSKYYITHLTPKDWFIKDYGIMKTNLVQLRLINDN